MRRCWTKRRGSTHIRIGAWRMRGSGRAQDPIRAWVRRCGRPRRLRGQSGRAGWMRPPHQIAGPRPPPGIERVRRDRCGVGHIRLRRKVSYTVSSRFRCREACRVPCVLASRHRFVHVEWTLANPSIRFGIGYWSEGRFYVFGGDHAVAGKLSWLRGCCDLCCARATSGQVAALPSRLMNSRRLMGFPVPRTTPSMLRYTISCMRTVLLDTCLSNSGSGCQALHCYPRRAHCSLRGRGVPSA
jgi:hypothetical protein